MNLFVVDNVEFNDDVVVTSAEVNEAILKLRDNKACGLDSITAEHLKLASKKLCPLVAMCYTVVLFMERYLILCSLLC